MDIDIVFKVIPIVRLKSQNRSGVDMEKQV